MLLSKAKSSIVAARLCVEHGHPDSAVSRAYYGMFQAAEAALVHLGFRRAQWTHMGLQSMFANELTRRRKLLPAFLVRRLNEALALRVTADYSEAEMSLNQARQALAWAEDFVRRVDEVTGHG